MKVFSEEFKRLLLLIGCVVSTMTAFQVLAIWASSNPAPVMLSVGGYYFPLIMMNMSVSFGILLAVSLLTVGPESSGVMLGVWIGVSALTLILGVVYTLCIYSILRLTTSLAPPDLITGAVTAMLLLIPMILESRITATHCKIAYRGGENYLKVCFIVLLAMIMVTLLMLVLHNDTSIEGAPEIERTMPRVPVDISGGWWYCIGWIIVSLHMLYIFYRKPNRLMPFCISAYVSAFLVARILAGISS